MMSLLRASTPTDTRVLAWFGMGGFLLAAILAGAAWLDRTHAAHDLEQAGLRLAAAEQDLQAQYDADQALREYAPRYRELQRVGFIGSQPPDWIQSLERLRKNVALPSLRYQLSPSQPLETEVDALNLYAAHLDLDLAIRHEGELFALLDLIASYLKGLTQPESCVVERGSVDTQALLSAHCRLRWFTLQDGKHAALWRG